MSSFEEVVVVRSIVVHSDMIQRFDIGFAIEVFCPITLFFGTLAIVVVALNIVFAHMGSSYSCIVGTCESSYVCSFSQVDLGLLALDFFLLLKVSLLFFLLILIVY